MNIKVVSEKTGLTKRAIKYYESEGLISPSKNSENNYREYSEKDIVKLNLISALRLLDISVADINSVITGNVSIPDIMEKALIRIDDSMQKLEKSRLIIKTIIDKGMQDYDTAGENIIRLRETLEFSMDEKKEFVSSILLRKFPGRFGQVFVAQYEPFLNITIDDEQKKETWLKLVDLLDDFDEINENCHFIKWYNNSGLSDADIEKMKKATGAKVKMYLDEEAFQKHIEKMALNFVQSLEDEEQVSMLKQLSTLTKEKMDVLGQTQVKFGKYLEILSEDYKKYIEYLKKSCIGMREEIKKLTGESMEELLEKHSIKSDY